jgi:hypothetical protein
MTPRWSEAVLVLLLLGAAACDSKSVVRVTGGDAALFRPMMAKAMSGEWALLQPAGPEDPQDSPCRTSMSIMIEVPDVQQYPHHDLPRGSVRLAFCGSWQDVAIDQVYLLYEIDGKDPSGVGCVLRSLDARDGESRWLLRWRSTGNQLMVTCDLPSDWRVALNEVAGMSAMWDREELGISQPPSLTYERRP